MNLICNMCSKITLLKLPLYKANELTHCGLITHYGHTDLGQDWLRLWLVAWRHLAITWTSVDFSKVQWNSVEGNLTRYSSPITKISLKITCLKFYSNLPGANELKVYALCPSLLYSLHYWQTGLCYNGTWHIPAPMQTWPPSSTVKNTTHQNYGLVSLISKLWYFLLFSTIKTFISPNLKPITWLQLYCAILSHLKKHNIVKKKDMISIISSQLQWKWHGFSWNNQHCVCQWTW